MHDFYATQRKQVKEIAKKRVRCLLQARKETKLSELNPVFQGILNAAELKDAVDAMVAAGEVVRELRAVTGPGRPATMLKWIGQ